MTPSQKKTALVIERLVSAAADGAKSGVYVSGMDEMRDVEADVRVAGRSVGIIKITPIGRPYWPDEERTP